MTTAETMAYLYPNKKWRIVYDKNGGETLEWNEPGPSPKLDDVKKAKVPSPPNIFEEIEALKVRVAALEAKK